MTTDTKRPRLNYAERYLSCVNLVASCVDDIDPRAVLTDRQRGQLRSALWRLFFNEWEGNAWRALQESRAM